MPNRSTIALIAAVLVLAACGDDASPPDTTTTTVAAAPDRGPAEVVFEAQESDGSTIVVASVTLPAPGFIAVHGNADGAPGPVIGHSELLPAGTSLDVLVTLDAPLTETDLVFPMAHIDIDEDGEYDFTPPDDTTDAPGLTADGSVAVVGAEVTVTTEAGAEIEIAGFDFGDPITVAVGVQVVIHNHDGVPHTWTSTDGVFDSGTIPGAADYTYTFDAPGEYDFFCSIHPSMTGTITVTG